MANLEVNLYRIDLSRNPEIEMSVIAHRFLQTFEKALLQLNDVSYAPFLAYLAKEFCKFRDWQCDAVI